PGGRRPLAQEAALPHPAGTCHVGVEGEGLLRESFGAALERGHAHVERIAKAPAQELLEALTQSRIIHRRRGEDVTARRRRSSERQAAGRAPAMRVSDSGSTCTGTPRATRRANSVRTRVITPAPARPRSRISRDAP